MSPRSVNDQITRRLLAWYGRYGRDLPWRNLPAGRQGTRNPYKILVSEIMLQQTQVARVLLFYKTWLKQFPTWSSLAKATNGEAVKAWAGLGYNRRALMLRNIAREVVARGVPRSEEAWRALKGIGSYTAAAVSLFSRGEKTVPIDTNIRRVWGRVLLGKAFPTLRLDEKLKKRLETVLKDEPRRADVFQATFDLATSVCTKQPQCETCPLKMVCPASKGFLSGKRRAPKRTTPLSHERIHTSKKYPDRIFRGRILKLVRESAGGVPIGRIGPIVDPSFDETRDTTWLRAMLKRLQQDGMVIQSRGKILLHE